jgi:hypothetical protein
LIVHAVTKPFERKQQGRPCCGIYIYNKRIEYRCTNEEKKKKEEEKIEKEQCRTRPAAEGSW